LIKELTFVVTGVLVNIERYDTADFIQRYMCGGEVTPLLESRTGELWAKQQLQHLGVRNLASATLK